MQDQVNLTSVSDGLKNQTFKSWWENKRTCKNKYSEIWRRVIESGKCW